MKPLRRSPEGCVLVTTLLCGSCRSSLGWILPAQLTGRPFGTPLALGTTAKALYQGRGRPHLFAGPAAAHRRPREWRIVVLRGLKDDDVVLSPADTDLEPGTDVAAGDPEPEAEPVTPVKKRRGRPRKTDAEREVAAVELEMAGGLGVGKVKKPRKRRKKGPEFSFVADGKVLSENCRGHLVVVRTATEADAKRCSWLREAINDRFGDAVNFHEEIIDEEGCNCFEVWFEGCDTLFLHSRQRQIDGEFDDEKLEAVLARIAEEGVSEAAFTTYGPF